jgi:hypothetical protein
MCKISDILSGNEATLGVYEPALNSNDLTLLKYAPVTCDVERSFSSYKTILSENRRFSLEDLKMHIVIYCNAAIKAE